jgi:hypothetical protein
MYLPATRLGAVPPSWSFHRLEAGRSATGTVHAQMLRSFLTPLRVILSVAILVAMVLSEPPPLSRSRHDCPAT